MDQIVLKRVTFAVPGDLSTPTGGYAYDARIIEGLRARGWQVEVADLGAHFPRPDGPALHAARNALAKIRPGGPLVIDGLAFGVLPETAPALAARHRLIALVHHPLALETGLSPTEAAAFKKSEHDALGYAHHVVATSPSTARLLASDYGVPQARISVVRPGNDVVKAAPRPAGDETLLLSVGAIVPRKGYDVLIEALGALKNLRWRLVIVGDPARDPAAAARLGRDIARLDLAGRVRLEGAVPAQRLAQLYASADLFVLASRHEGYGMAYAEALAAGLPVIGTTAGAIPDTVPPEAGLLVPPDDAGALAETLRSLIADPAERGRLAAGARALSLPTWEDAASAFARAIEAAAPEAPVPKAPSPKATA